MENNNEERDENGGHGYVEHAAIGNAIVHVFYGDEYKDTGDDR